MLLMEAPQEDEHLVVARFQELQRAAPECLVPFPQRDEPFHPTVPSAAAGEDGGGVVLGVRDLDLSTIQELPPLLGGTSTDFLEAIGTLDEQFIMVLRAGWELPDEVWAALAAQELAS